jgi:predicted membrane-bound spermidine synthase
MGEEEFGQLRSQLGGLFFLSGAAALIYQVCWQRVLFTNLGMDAGSVAIIVSIFMLGLGAGALLGGWVADKRLSLVGCFALLELGIAGYGLISVWLIGAVSGWIGAAGTWAVILASLLVLFIPTCLMGMTLPVLVIHLDRVMKNIGESTGTLYLSNTMGAAVGAIATGLYLFRFMTLSQVVWLAVALNITVATLGVMLLLRGRE